AAPARVASTPVALPPLERAERPSVSEPRSTTALREGGVRATLTAGVVEIASVVSEPPGVEASLDPLDGLVADPTAPLEQVGQEIASTADSLVVATEQLVDDVGDGVVGLLDDVGAEQVAAVVEPIIDTTTELLIDDVVEPVVDEAGTVVVDATTMVASTADGLLALIDPH
ncbi:MAG TPA: hypothetical protein VFD53_11450, partial [Ilumatobacter sp.]|nr:hypothetical protein [Ilumatobacter sp.]